MLWLQAGICFIFWISYGIVMRGRAEGIRAKVSNWSRGQRVAFGSAGLILGLIFLLLGLYLVAMLGGIQDEQLTLWAWAACLILGLGFIHLQVMGATAMITLALEEETDRRGRTSIPEEPK